MKTMLTLLVLAIGSAMTLQAADGDKPKPPGGGDKPKPPGEGGKPRPSPEEIFKKLDADADGFISKDEFMASPRAQENKEKAEARFTELDADKDGKLSKDEFMAGHKKGDRPPGKGGDKPGQKKPGQGDKPGPKPEQK